MSALVPRSARSLRRLTPPSVIVKRVPPEGFIKFQTLGGWLDKGIINQRYIIYAARMAY